MKSSILRIAAALAVVVGACTATGFHSSCFDVVYGEITVDWSHGFASVAGFCIRRLHPSCPTLQKCKVEAGVDQNGDGKLDPSEVTTSYDDRNPGDTFCVTSASVNLGPADHGKKVILHYEASRSDQPDTPFVSKNDSKTLE